MKTIRILTSDRHRASRACLTFLAASLAATAAGRADTIYVSNWNNDTIEKFDSVTGHDFGVFANVAGPRGVALDNAGNLYVAAYSSSSILKYTPGGVESVFATGLGHAEGMAFDSAGNLYVADYVANIILKFTPGGASSTFASTGLNQPYGLAFDSAGNLYAANAGANTIEKFTPQGVGSVFAAAGLQSPMGLAFDSAGNLYAANYGGHNIQKFTPGGVGSVFASGLTDPVGLAFDSAGNLYAADEWSMPTYGSVVKFTPTGVGSVFASTYLSGPVYLAIPEPSITVLLGLALAALLAKTRRTPPRT